MAISLETLAIRLSNQLVSNMEEHDALKSRFRLVSTQAAAVQAENAALTHRLFNRATHGLRHEAELRSLADDKKRLVGKLRAVLVSAHALRIAVSPKGRLASLFDRLFEQLEDSDMTGNSQQDSETEAAFPVTERKSRERRRDPSPSPSSVTTA